MHRFQALGEIKKALNSFLCHKREIPRNAVIENISRLRSHVAGKHAERLDWRGSCKCGHWRNWGVRDLFLVPACPLSCNVIHLYPVIPPLIHKFLVLMRFSIFPSTQRCDTCEIRNGMKSNQVETRALTDSDQYALKVHFLPEGNVLALYIWVMPTM